MVATASVIRARNSSKLTGRGGTKLHLQLLSTQKSPGMLNQAIVVARLSFHHVQTKQTPYDRDCKISKQHCTIGMPSGGSNENTRTRSNFRDVPDQTVTSSSEVMTADFFFV